jgi:hypothetical protein
VRLLGVGVGSLVRDTSGGEPPQERLGVALDTP